MTGSLVAARGAARGAVADAALSAHAQHAQHAEHAEHAHGAKPATGTTPLLTVSGLSVSYGRLRALENVDLSVQSGELVALAAQNGAGKTTLVRCIAGDVVPASGEIHLGGKRVPPDPAAAARQGVAVVLQDPALCANLDIASHLLLGQEPH